MSEAQDKAEITEESVDIPEPQPYVPMEIPTAQEQPPEEIAAPDIEPSLFGNYGNTPPPKLAADLHGPFDAYAAKVVQVFYSGGTAPHGDTNAIAVERITYRYGTNNAIVGGMVAQAGGEPTWAISYPFPAIPQSSQEGYRVAVGDIVTVVSGKDGMCYYFSDETPFIAMVIAQNDSTYEATNGGAYANTDTVAERRLKIRRYLIPNTGGVAFTAALDASSNYIEYSNVIVMSPNRWKSCGYRCGDFVLVERRGTYYMIQPGSDWFLGVIVDAGPDGEGDFTDNRYWVREVTYSSSYSSDSTNSYAAPTFVEKDNAVDTTSGGRIGRWITAVNLAEQCVPTYGTTASYHSLELMDADDAIATASYYQLVIVHCSDSKSADTDYKNQRTLYFFERTPPFPWPFANPTKPAVFGWDSTNGPHWCELDEYEYAQNNGSALLVADNVKLPEDA